MSCKGIGKSLLSELAGGIDEISESLDTAIDELVDGVADGIGLTAAKAKFGRDADRNRNVFPKRISLEDFFEQLKEGILSEELQTIMNLGTNTCRCGEN